MKTLIITAIVIGLSTVSIADEVRGFAVVDGRSVSAVPYCNSKPRKLIRHKKKVVIVKKVQNECKPKTIRVTEYERVKVIERVEIKPYKNRLRALGGVGPKGNSVNEHSDYVSLDQSRGLVLGLGYDRLLTKHWSVGGAALTNKTFLLNLGYDF